jgi:hypothetical protein
MECLDGLGEGESREGDSGLEACGKSNDGSFITHGARLVTCGESVLYHCKELMWNGCKVGVVLDGVVKVLLFGGIEHDNPLAALNNYLPINGGLSICHLRQ